MPSLTIQYGGLTEWRKLWDLTEKLKFCENEPSDPQFCLHFKQKYVDMIQNPL
jgi:hypothetical protein